MIQHVRKRHVWHDGWLTFSREARLATLSDHRPMDWCSLKIDKLAMWSRPRDRSAYGRYKYVSRLVGEISFVRVSSLHFYAIHSRLIASRRIETRLLDRVRSISRSIFYLAYPVHRRFFNAWIDAASEEEFAKTINIGGLSMNDRYPDRSLYRCQLNISKKDSCYYIHFNYMYR